jgi:hypothetical protein
MDDNYIFLFIEWNFLIAVRKIVLARVLISANTNTIAVLNIINPKRTAIFLITPPDFYGPPARWRKSPGERFSASGNPLRAPPFS